MCVHFERRFSLRASASGTASRHICDARRQLPGHGPGRGVGWRNGRAAPRRLLDHLMAVVAGICLSLAIAMIVRARRSGKAGRPLPPGMLADLPGAEPESGSRTRCLQAVRLLDPAAEPSAAPRVPGGRLAVRRRRRTWLSRRHAAGAAPPPRPEWPWLLRRTRHRLCREQICGGRRLAGDSRNVDLLRRQGRAGAAVTQGPLPCAQSGTARQGRVQR